MTQFSQYFVVGPNNTLRNKQGINWSHNGKKQQIYGETEIDRWYVGEYSSATYQIIAEYSNNFKETTNILLVATPNNASIIDYGRVSSSGKLLNFSVDVNTSYVSLSATPINSTFNGVKLTFTATYIENIDTLSPTFSTKNIQQNKFYSEYGFETSGISLSEGKLTNSSIETNALEIGSSLSVLNGVVTLTSQNSPGTINNIIIGNITPQSGTFTELIVQNNVTIAPSVEGSINNVTIGDVTPREGTFTTTNSTVSNITTGNITTGNITTADITTADITTADITTADITNLNATAVTADDVTINNQPTSISHATRKDYVDNISAALAVALGG